MVRAKRSCTWQSWGWRIWLQKSQQGANQVRSWGMSTSFPDKRPEAKHSSLEHTKSSQRAEEVRRGSWKGAKGQARSFGEKRREIDHTSLRASDTLNFTSTWHGQILTVEEQVLTRRGATLQSEKSFRSQQQESRARQRGQEESDAWGSVEREWIWESSRGHSMRNLPAAPAVDSLDSHAASSGYQVLGTRGWAPVTGLNSSRQQLLSVHSLTGMHG